MTANRFLVTLLLMLSAWPLQAAEPAKPLTVFAAASLKESLDEAARAYEKQTGDKVVFNFGATQS